jgi:hypothetical protein
VERMRSRRFQSGRYVSFWNATAPTVGDFVLFHCHRTGFFGVSGDAIIDIFTLEDGKVVECQPTSTCESCRGFLENLCCLAVGSSGKSNWLGERILSVTSTAGTR